jgi:hypothetical protein
MQDGFDYGSVIGAWAPRLRGRRQLRRNKRPLPVGKLDAIVHIADQLRIPQLVLQ